MQVENKGEIFFYSDFLETRKKNQNFEKQLSKLSNSEESGFYEGNLSLFGFGVVHHSRHDRIFFFGNLKKKTVLFFYLYEIKDCLS